VVAPDDFGLGPATTFWVNQAHTAMEGNRRAHNRHTAGVADVYRDRISGLTSRVFVPLDKKLYLRKDAFVTT